MNKRIILILAVVALAALALSGCGPKTVDLTYSPVVNISQTCGAPVTVVKFADMRTNKVLGTSRRNEYVASEDVGEWVAKAMVDEFTKAGCTAVYADTAGMTTTPYEITGDVTSVNFSRPAYASFHTDVDMKVQLSEGDWTSFIQTYHVETSEDGKAYDESMILERDLQGAMQKIVPELVSRIQ